MKAKVWITLQVEVEVSGATELECRQAAVAKIPDLEPDDHYDAINRAMNIGKSYPCDVTEIVEVLS